MREGSALSSPGAEEPDRIELVAAVLLALATVATAWSGYQAKSFSRANAARIESTRASELANAQTQIDVATFIQWVDAYALEETELADFYVKRFRAEFKPAVDAWIATRPLENPDAPLTPFAMTEYELAARQEARELEAEADALSAQARTNVQRADQLRLRHRSLRHRALLRGHGREVPDKAPAHRAARVRGCHPRRDDHVAGHVPRQPLGLSRLSGR